MSYRNSATIAESQILSPWRLWESERIELRAPALNFPHLQGGFPLLDRWSGKEGGEGCASIQGKEGGASPGEGEVLPFETFNATSTKTFSDQLSCPPSPETCKSCALCVVLEHLRGWKHLCWNHLPVHCSGNGFKCCNIDTFILSFNEKFS